MVSSVLIDFALLDRLPHSPKAQVTEPVVGRKTGQAKGLLDLDSELLHHGVGNLDCERLAHFILGSRN